MRLDIPLLPLGLAVLLSAHGLRKKSLSPSGALAAFVVGLLMMSGGVRVFGVMLIGFYLIGSRATKYGKKRKAMLEDGYHDAGYRSGWQVLCNSAAALVAAFVWNAAFAPGSLQSWMAQAVGVEVGRGVLGLPRRVNYSSGKWCPLEAGVANGWSRALMFAALGHFACCLGDTLASELGILSRSKPRLVTTFKTVPPGTNGAMSVGGTIASVVGGGLVGAMMGVSLVVENERCFNVWGEVVLESAGWGMAAGGFGSLVDSVMGATVQRTRYSRERGVVLQDGGGGDGEVISGWDILSNNQVNLVSSVVCAVVAGWVTSY